MEKCTENRKSENNEEYDQKSIRNIENYQQEINENYKNQQIITSYTLPSNNGTIMFKNSLKNV